MIAVIGAAGVTVEEPDVLTALSARLNGIDADTANAVLDAGERVDDEHAWLAVERLRAAGPADPAWRDGFAAMIDYADHHGWVEGGLVRAHLG